MTRSHRVSRGSPRPGRAGGRRGTEAKTTQRWQGRGGGDSFGRLQGARERRSYKYNRLARLACCAKSDDRRKDGVRTTLALNRIPSRQRSATPSAKFVSSFR